MNQPGRLASLLSLLELARLGAQFPDAARWRALVEVLQRGGPRGRPMHITLSPVSGLISARSLLHLHRLQFVAREFFEKHRARPSKEARAFSMALAAVELPPLSATTARLVSTSKSVTRVQLVHEVLAHTAVRFTLTLEQGARGPIKVGKDKLCTVSDALALTLKTVGAGTAGEAMVALSAKKDLTVIEVVRGELGPVVWGGEGARADPLRARLGALCRTDADAVLSVTLQRLAADVAQNSTRDPWAPAALPTPGFKLAHERRLFCPGALAEPLRALAGKQVLVRSVP